MKTFYTVRDIEDMHAAGVVEIDIHDDVVLTDVAREKAIALGLHLKPADQAGSDRRSAGIPRMIKADRTGSPPTAVNPRSTATASPAPAQTGIGGPPSDLAMKIKTAVVARLGTDQYNDQLDQIISRVISRLKTHP